jgi:hypothetical protein
MLLRMQVFWYVMPCCYVFSDVVEAFEALINILGAPKPSKKKVPVSFETSVNTNPVTQPHPRTPGSLFVTSIIKLITVIVKSVVTLLTTATIETLMPW